MHLKPRLSGSDRSFQKQISIDRYYMKKALFLSKSALGKTFPNPSVGCVFVKNRRIIAQGVTGRGGRPHAEQQALKQAGIQARNADVYVSLEPCIHYGKTSPCARALVKAHIRRLIIACLDPDPRVDGKGVQYLIRSGIDVSVGLYQKEAEWIHAGFFSRIYRKRPLLVLDKNPLGYDMDMDGVSREQIKGQTWLKTLQMLSKQGITRIRVAPDDKRLADLKEQKLIDYDLTDCTGE